jgi:hypothetical protein
MSMPRYPGKPSDRARINKAKTERFADCSLQPQAQPGANSEFTSRTLGAALPHEAS